MNSPLAIMRALWTRLLNRGGTTPQQEIYNAGGRRALNVSGVYVDDNTALTFAAVWCAIRAIAEPLAAMPYHVFMSEGRKNTLVSGHPVDWLLSMQPNPEMTAFDFWDLMAQRMVMGNAIAEIERNNRGEPAWLWPLESPRVLLRRNAAGGLQYEVTNQNKEVTILDPADVYHLRGLGDGLWGYSVIGMARDSIGMGLAMEQFGSAFFGSGAHLGATIQAPVGGQQLPKPAVDALIAEFDKRHSGAKNAFRTTYLDRGMTVAYPTLTAEESQFLQSRQFSILEICRWFRVPPHLLYDLSRATFSNIEHQSLEYVQHTLQPWAKRIEKQTDVKLFGRQQRGVYYSKFNFDSMLRGDITSRYTAYGQAKQNGWMSTNDIRFKEDLNPVKGGDEYLVQVNMTPSDLLRAQAEANIKQTNAPPPAPAPAATGNNPPASPAQRAAAAVHAIAERARS